MIYDRRCALCGRLLAITATAGNRTPLYCPDRLCILYPTPTHSPGRDPTHSSWALAIHMLTDITDAEACRTFGKNPTWMRELVKQHVKRWEHFR